MIDACNNNYRLFVHVNVVDFDPTTVAVTSVDFKMYYYYNVLRPSRART